jgi:hypothetical protein
MDQNNSFTKLLETISVIRLHVVTEGNLFDDGYHVLSTLLMSIFVLYLTHWMNQLAENNAAEAAADKQATDDPNSLIRFQISRFNRRFFF